MRPRLTVALMGMAFMIVPGAHASRELSLSQEFRTCVAVRDVGLMSDLMRTVWDLPFRKSGAFEKEHGPRIKTGTLTQSRLGPLDSSMASTEARVELSGQDKLLGIPARAVSAVTCEEGCVPITITCPTNKAITGQYTGVMSSICYTAYCLLKHNVA